MSSSASACSKRAAAAKVDVVGERAAGQDKHDADNQRAKRAKQAKAERARKNQLKTRKIDGAFAQEVTPYVSGELRHVPPYFYELEGYVKGRWCGRTVLDVYAKEFASESEAYYQKAIAIGQIKVDGQRVTADTCLKTNSVISHRMHRHEPPVPAEPVTVIHDDDTVLVVNKPAGMPVHPCGRYRHNTVLGILGHTQGYWNLCVTHRLDRQTSGVLLFAKSPAAADRVRGDMVSHRVKKTYLARVRGRFPEAATCDLSIAMSNARIGVCRADPEKGKPAQTDFTRLHYNEADDTSLVRCAPKTGRMHQIRVHLQCLGHPIVDDNVYARPEWGEESGVRASDATVTRIAEAVERDMHRAGIDLEWDAAVAGPLPAEMSSLSEHKGENGDAYLCSQCVREAAAGHVEEVNPSRISLCLHAESYEGPDWRYTAPSPPWATQ